MGFVPGLTLEPALDQPWITTKLGGKEQRFRLALHPFSVHHFQTCRWTGLAQVIKHLSPSDSPKTGMPFDAIFVQRCIYTIKAQLCTLFCHTYPLCHGIMWTNCMQAS